MDPLSIGLTLGTGLAGGIGSYLTAQGQQRAQQAAMKSLQDRSQNIAKFSWQDENQ
jgi:hypothetical protein